VVSSKLSSRAALTGPGAVEAEAEPGTSGVKELRLPREGPVCLTPPAMPGPWATLTAELPKADRGMLAVRLAAEKEAAGAVRPVVEKEARPAAEQEASEGQADKAEGP